MQESLYQAIAPAPMVPTSLIVLAYATTGILLVIMILMFRINAKISALSTRPNRQSNSEKSENSQPVEAGSGTPFDEFLKEDPSRLILPKKEQFKAYREWRSEKGLNWSAKD